MTRKFLFGCKKGLYIMQNMMIVVREMVTWEKIKHKELLNAKG